MSVWVLAIEIQLFFAVRAVSSSSVKITLWFMQLSQQIVFLSKLQEEKQSGYLLVKSEGNYFLIKKM